MFSKTITNNIFKKNNEINFHLQSLVVSFKELPNDLLKQKKFVLRNDKKEEENLDIIRNEKKDEKDEKESKKEDVKEKDIKKTKKKMRKKIKKKRMVKILI